jgi:hypothetical protein
MASWFVAAGTAGLYLHDARANLKSNAAALVVRWLRKAR